MSRSPVFRLPEDRRATLPAMGAMVTTGAALALLIGSAFSADAKPREPAEEAQSQAWIGVGLRGAGAGRGVVLERIYIDTPAADAGLRAGDAILAVGNVRVISTGELIAVVKRHTPGEQVKLLVLRAGARIRVPVILAEKPTRSELVYRKLVGKPTPSFELPVANGMGSGTLSDYHGRIVVITLFSTRCVTCARVLEALDIAARTRGTEVSFLGVAPQPVASLRAATSRRGLRMLVLADEGGQLQELYDWPSTAVPLIAVVDRYGVVHFAGTLEPDLTARNSAEAAALLIDHALFVVDRLAGSHGSIPRGAPRARSASHR